MNTEFEYVSEYYKALLSHARQETMDGLEVTVFRGSVTKVFRELSISQSYYSRVMDALKELGCLDVMRRGARGIDSVVLLHHPPNETEFLVRAESHLTTPRDRDKLAERVEAMEKLLGRFDIAKAIEHLDREVKELRGRVGELEQLREGQG